MFIRKEIKEVLMHRNEIKQRIKKKRTSCTGKDVLMRK
jgi:sRNA-binding carbon storage regulator CsrA